MWTKVILVVLAFSFIAVVFAYGTGQRYDVWAHFQKIVSTVDHAPSLEYVVEIWTAEYLIEKKTKVGRIWLGNPDYLDDAPFWPIPEEGLNPGIPEDQWNEYRNPDNFAYGDVEYEERIYPDRVTEQDWGVFEPIQSFIGAIKGFFVRLYYTVRWVIDLFVFAFNIVTVVAPWNGYVKEV